MAVNWFVNKVFPVRIDGGGTTDEHEASLLLLMGDGFKAPHKRLAMVALGPLVIG